MSRAERRYFKLYTSRHVLGGHSNYQLLFDAIAAMDTYDEAALLLKFKKHAFTKRFPITKRRLYEAILRSLDAFHAESSVDARLHRMLHHVELLYHRALYTDAQKILTSVRKLARSHDRQSVLLEVVAWDRRFMERTSYAGVNAAALDELNGHAEALRQEIQQIDALWHLKSTSFLTLYHQGHARDTDRLKELRALLLHPLLRPEAVLITAKAQFLHHHVHSVVDFARGDLSSCHAHLSANEKVLEEHADLFSDEPNLLLSVISNRAYVAHRLGRTQEAMKALAKVRLLPKQLRKAPDRDLSVKVFAMGYSLEMAFHAHLGEFEKATALIPAMEEGLNTFAEQLSPLRKAGLYYQAAYAHFGAGRIELALKWSHEQLNLPGLDETTETYCFGRMLNLLIHLEMGHKDLLPYTLRSMERYLKDRQRTYRFETVFLDFLRERIKAKDTDAERVALERFRAGVVPLSEDPLEQAVMDHLDPLAWVEAKLTGRSFAQLVQERAIDRATAA